MSSTLSLSLNRVNRGAESSWHSSEMKRFFWRNVTNVSLTVPWKSKLGTSTVRDLSVVEAVTKELTIGKWSTFTATVIPIFAACNVPTVTKVRIQLVWGHVCTDWGWSYNIPRADSTVHRGGAGTAWFLKVSPQQPFAPILPGVL